MIKYSLMYTSLRIVICSKYYVLFFQYTYFFIVRKATACEKSQLSLWRSNVANFYDIFGQNCDSSIIILFTRFLNLFYKLFDINYFFSRMNAECARADSSITL